MSTFSTADISPNGKPKSVMLSSNTTLAWRIFVPIFGTSFMTALLFIFWLTDPSETRLWGLTGWGARATMTLLWLGWLYFVRRTFWRLKRVDADPTHFFITNYWTTVRYPWGDLSHIEEKTRMGRRIVQFHLKGSGRFGSVISFLPGTLYDAWQAERSKMANTVDTSNF